MEKRQVEWFVSNCLQSTIVTCKKAQKKGKTGYSITIKAVAKEKEELVLSSSEKERLIQLAKNDCCQYIEELITLNINGSKLIESYSGSNYLLPNRFSRFYESCVRFETEEGYSIYFCDKAIEKFRDVILKLDKQTRNDCFKFVQEKIESKEAKNLSLAILDGYSFKRGLSASYYRGDSIMPSLDPPYSVYYHTDMSKEGKVLKKDLENITGLIDIFAKNYGNFDFIKYTDKELVAYNLGSMRIIGLDKSDELFSKVLSLRKKER